MSKAAIMDKSLEGKTISSSVICEIVHSVFGVNLDEVPIITKIDTIEYPLSKGDKLTSRLVIDSYLNQSDEEITGEYIRRMINDIFGVNLDAISSLEGERISLYSKGRWVVQNETDLFVVHTGTGDVDVDIYPTTYFKEQADVTQLQTNLHPLLIGLGYTYNEGTGRFYFSNPTGEAVPDAFKGQTIAVVSKVIRESFSHL